MREFSCSEADPHPCGGLCQACNVAPNEGACLPLTGDPTLAGHKPCAGTGACQGACDGSNTTTCLFPSSAQTCGKGSCNGDTATPATTCDGAGKCSVPATKSCAPTACDMATGDCKETCATQADCAQGAICDTATNKCAPAAGTCSDAFTAKSPDGQLVPCAPYRCKNGACQSACSSSADCADGATCDGKGCVAAPAAGAAPADPGDSGGCAIHGGTGEDMASWLGGLLALGITARRRNRTLRVAS